MHLQAWCLASDTKRSAEIWWSKETMWWEVALIEDGETVGDGSGTTPTNAFSDALVAWEAANA